MKYHIIVEVSEDYPSDVTKVVLAFEAHGYTCSRLQAVTMWRAYSDSLCAGWLLIDGYKAADIVAACRPYFSEVGE